MWAIASGIEGNIQAYEALLDQLKYQEIEHLFILGDIIGLSDDSVAVIDRIQHPKPDELVPQVCRGWWEEQLLILHAMSTQEAPDELIAIYGRDAMKTLWDAVPRELVPWISQLDFGIFELDCILVHGSSSNVAEELSPETAPIVMLNRVQAVEANILFTGRSGLTFEYELTESQIRSKVSTLDNLGPADATTTRQSQSRRVIGVGSLGRVPGEATYTRFEPQTGQVNFEVIRYRPRIEVE
jgi:hypothetical protein